MRRPPKLEWLGLMDVVGPFVTPTIIAEAFPNGLEGHDSSLLKGLRGAYKTWEESDDPIYHREWVNVVLTSVLGYQDKHIQQDQAIPESLSYVDRTHHTTIRPTFIIHQPEIPDRGRLLIIRLPKGESTSKPKAGAKWQTSPISQMQMLLQATNEKIGVVTNGEEWVLVNNCGTGAVGFATWYAYLWSEEHDTLRSFRSLIGIRRVFGGEPGQRLVALLTKGSEDQQEVTDRLGYQVRRAVEELVGAFERLDRDSKRELLRSVSETQVYEGVLTVMMRLVFLFCAEERGLLHLGEQLYDDYYAVSTLREQLHDDASKLTEEVLDRRSAAWCRLLATFRMVYQGVEHEDLRIPAYGGTLFDPDRFPWLEGRTADNSNEPPHVSDRIVLHLLDSLQVLRRGQEARKLSFHALDVEQIGHVYEGLLDHTAKRATKPVLGLVGKEGDEPEVALEALEAKAVEGRDKYFAYLKEQTGKTERALEGLLGQLADSEKLRKIRVTCGEDHELFERIMPFANLIREDSFGNVQVYPEGALYATAGSDRRSTGTHYTPKSLCEEVVNYALEPLVYVGPTEGLPEDEWTLKSAKSIVDLKVCDMAMGSGAFLVAACRYLSVKLTEAWALAEERADRRLGFSLEGHFFTHSTSDDHHAKKPGTTVTTPFGAVAVADPSQELIPSDSEERLALARRIVADRCLYGVDRNAMAVEMAKLSLWLTTLRKDRPFTFLDHCLRHGDSLLGASERQLELFNMNTSGQSEALLLPWVPEYAETVRNLRQQIARIPSHDPEAIRRKHRLFEQVRELELPLKFAADALVACELSEGNVRDKAARRGEIQATLTVVPSGDRLMSTYKELAGRPTFHWQIEFPDVFAMGGFDALVGNPPYLGGKRISTELGADYESFLKSVLSPDVKAAGDLAAHFLWRAVCLGHKTSISGLITTDKISQGESRILGPDRVTNCGATFFRVQASIPWPGEAQTRISIFHFAKGPYEGVKLLNGQPTDNIGTDFESGDEFRPISLSTCPIFASIGSYLYGEGFVLSPDQASQFLKLDPSSEAVIRPYLVANDLTNTDDSQATRFVISFGEMGESMASRWEAPFRHLVDTVKPVREKLTGQIHQDCFWKFWDLRPELYSALNSLETVIVAPRVSRYISFEKVSSKQVFGDRIVVFATEDDFFLGVLQSTMHQLWIDKTQTSMGTAPTYVVKNCLRTFPFPRAETTKIEDFKRITAGMLEARSQARRVLTLGLTNLYAALDDTGNSSPYIQRLRDAVMFLDSAVCDCYGWEDLDLDHGFHVTPQGVRFTISPEARKEVLLRLLKLNHERYAEEVAAGLHDKKLKKAKAAESSAEKRGRKPKSIPGDSIVRESAANYDASGPETDQRDLFEQQLALGGHE